VETAEAEAVEAAALEAAVTQLAAAELAAAEVTAKATADKIVMEKTAAARLATEKGEVVATGNQQARINEQASICERNTFVRELTHSAACVYE
jgi:ribosomal protein L16/L10AE